MSDTIFKKIAEYQYSSQAYIFKGKLESLGIEVVIRDNYTVDSDPLISNAIGGVKLFVKTEDFVEAKKILLEINKFSVDDEGNAMKCPNCNSEEIKFVTTIKDLKSFLAFLISFLFVLFPFYTRYKYRCHKCNTEFK